MSLGDCVVQVSSHFSSLHFLVRLCLRFRVGLIFLVYLSSPISSLPRTSLRDLTGMYLGLSKDVSEVTTVKSPSLDGPEVLCRLPVLCDFRRLSQDLPKCYTTSVYSTGKFLLILKQSTCLPSRPVRYFPLQVTFPGLRIVSYKPSCFSLNHIYLRTSFNKSLLLTMRGIHISMNCQVFF